MAISEDERRDRLWNRNIDRYSTTAQADRVLIINPNGSDFSSSLIFEEHDYILREYDGSDNITTATYKSGGSSGTIVATLVYAWSGGNLVSTTKTTP